jgi:shikimate kinase
MKIYLIGFMGCGKTHWGKQLSRKLEIPFFDLDEQIVANEGKSVNEIFEIEGEEYFRLKEKEVLYILTESHEDFVMACGGGTPCFYNNIDYMNSSGTSVWINSSVDMLFERLIKEKEGRPLIRDLTDEQLRSYIAKKYADRRIYYQQATVIIDNDEVSLEKLVEEIMSAESTQPRRKW